MYEIIKCNKKIQDAPTRNEVKYITKRQGLNLAVADTLLTR